MIPDFRMPCSTACAEAAGAADGVDGAHVVVVPAFDGAPGLEVDAERRAEQRELDVVDGERVAGEQHLHVAGANQLGQIRRAAGVHDDRSGDEGDLPPVGA